MRHVRFRLTGWADRDITRAQQPRTVSKAAGGALVWIAAGAAALYWLSGAKKGDVWPLPNLTPPTIEVPDHLDFGDQQVDTRSQSRAVTLKVAAGRDQPLRVGAPKLNDPQSLDFTIDHDSCTNVTLRVGDTCAVGVSFYSSSLGIRSAILLIPTSQRTQEVSLRGNAVPPPPIDGTTPNITARRDPHVHPILIGGKVTEPVPVYHPLPAYPETARIARTQGVVHLSGTITKNGDVVGLHTLDGDAVLAAAAIAAVSQWRYRSATLNGKPIDDQLQVAITFTLVPVPPAPPPSEGATPSKGD